MVVGAVFTVGALGATVAAASPEQALRRASVMVEAGRFKEAVVILKEVEPQTRGDDLALSVLAGKIYLAIDRPTKALEFFEDADAQARRYLQAARRVDQDSAEPDYVLAVIALSLLGVPD